MPFGVNRTPDMGPSLPIKLAMAVSPMPFGVNRTPDAVYETRVKEGPDRVTNAFRR